ncbi:YqaA family protein [Sulfitobacter sp. PS-8MA]|uniref:YqaA family protein n=1 Tax=Sulfitobacter sp. PS-8MA TaxID=3237707 RepID=UPI0034C6D5CC
MLALSSLFAAAFFAATLIPAQSEAVLLGLIWAEAHPVALLLLVATAGNVLGSLVNWLLGRYLALVATRRWFPFSPAQLRRASDWYQRWGYWSLLASWMPLIGDPLTLAAGVLKEPLWRFLLIVTLAKGGRYLLLAAAALNAL